MDSDARIFKALGDDTRLTIVKCLIKSERCACEFTRLAPKDQTTISRHLHILVEAGILKREKRGRNIFYSVKDRVMEKRLRAMGLKECC